MLTRSVNLSSSLSCKQQRVRSIELVFRRSNYPLIKRIDPFLGGTRNYVNISQSRLKQLSEAKRVKNEEFIPSFILSSKNKKRFKYLTHIHIANAGTTFGHTLAKMADFLHFETTKCRMKSNKYVNYLSHGDLIDKDHIDAIANTILSNQIWWDTLEGSFISCYWNNWEVIRDLLSRKYKAESVLFSIIRDPFKRLVSNLKHNAYYNSLDIDQLKEYVYSYPQNFFNTIASSLPKNLNRDDLIAAENVINFSNQLSKKPTSLLPFYAKPLQKRTYNSESQRQYRKRLPNENLILNFARQLTDELFIKDDTEIYNYLMRTKCKSEFDFWRFSWRRNTPFNNCNRRL